MRPTLAPLAILAAIGAHAAAQPEILVREHPHDWTLKTEITIRAWDNTRQIPNRPRNVQELPRSDTWEFDNASVVFPVLESTASSTTNLDGVTGEAQFEGRTADEAPEILAKQYHSGTRLAMWELGPQRGKQMRLDVSVPSTCYRTVFNEDIANQLDWPTDDWPQEAASTFEPMSFVDIGPDGRPYDMRPIRALVRKWTDGKDPRTVKPAVLAKWFLGNLVDSYQISGNGLAASRNGLLEGLALDGAPAAAASMRGCEFDMVSVLVACYREAGLPARVVIAYDAGSAKNGDNFLDRKRSDLQVRAWAEFALWNPVAKKVVWIPVDVVRIRERNSRMPDGYMNQPVKFFGTHDKLDDMIPFAFQFHPPTTVRAYGSPGFWGWLVFGEQGPPDRAIQEIRFLAITTPTRGGDQQQQRRRR